MEPGPPPTFNPAGAGGVLIGTTLAVTGAGALVGWAAGNVGWGVLGGAVVGVPAGVAAVVVRYRGAI